MQDLNFLVISDPKIWAMPVQECHEALVDLKNYDFSISLNRASYYAGYTKVRESVAKKLIAANKKLPAGMQLHFSEGHRPISLQAQMYIEHYSNLAKDNPTWDEERLRFETVQYIAPPLDVPPHSTGGAIDLTIIDQNGKELDMGGILDETPDKNENRNFTYTKNISDVAKKNRKILIDVLSAEGFVNYPAEWWHWSYGDKYWAYHTQHPHALYNSIE